MRTILVLGILIAATMMFPTAVAKQTDPCNGFWYYEEDVGPTTVYTNGSAKCTGAYVFLPSLRQCVTEGGYSHVQSVGNVHIYQRECA